MSRDDTELTEMVERELGTILGTGLVSQASVVCRMPNALPLYSPGHRERVERLGRRLREIGRMACVGNYLEGVGLSDCVRVARRVADECAAIDAGPLLGRRGAL